jgi:hypothetical protein
MALDEAEEAIEQAQAQVDAANLRASTAESSAASAEANAQVTMQRLGEASAEARRWERTLETERSRWMRLVLAGLSLSQHE